MVMSGLTFGEGHIMTIIIRENMTITQIGLYELLRQSDKDISLVTSDKPSFSKGQSNMGPPPLPIKEGTYLGVPFKVTWDPPINEGSFLGLPF